MTDIKPKGMDARDIIRIIWAIGLNISFILIVAHTALFVNSGQAYRFSQCYIESFD